MKLILIMLLFVLAGISLGCYIEMYLKSMEKHAEITDKLTNVDILRTVGLVGILIIFGSFLSIALQVYFNN